MSNILNELNDIQKDAVTSGNGPALIIAGAGSGKTRVLTYRIAWLLEHGVAPWHILALTFTNKASSEMRERIASLVGSDTAKRLWMGTFHSIFARILRQEAQHIGYTSSFTIYDTQDSRSVVKQIIKSHQLDEQVYKPNDIYGRISQAKNNLITPAVYASNTQAAAQDKAAGKPMISQIFSEYASRCFKAGAMDFDDILIYTNILLRDNPDILEKYQNHFRYIMVDEYQDTNFAQYLIVKKLAEKHQNICVVGDDAQSIYAFRGAKIENILNFRNDYPDYKLFKLEQNYRSTQTIVNAANSVIAKNINQIKKKVFSDNEVGDPVLVIRTASDHEEGHEVASRILDLKYSKRLKNSDFAILYRTNAQSRILEDALRKRNIPYKIFGGLSFYQRKEIKDILAYLRLIVNPKDNEAFRRIINYPARGIGDTTLSRLDESARQNGISLWEVCLDTVNLVPAINNGTRQKVAGFTGIIKTLAEKKPHTDAYNLTYEAIVLSGIMQDLKSEKTPEAVSRVENTEALLNGIKEFTASQAEEGEPATLENFLESVALLSDMDNDNKEEDIDKVSLMTIHSSKGLEFDTIFITGMEELLFPGQQSISSNHELEEERRLFYVAITRGKSRVVLSYAESRYKWGSPTMCSPSRFLSDIDPGFIETPNNPAYMQEPGNPMSSSFRPRSITVSNPKPAYMQGKEKPATQNRYYQPRPQPQPQNQSQDSEFESSPPELIKEGMTVLHQRFGPGKVVKIEGRWPDIKATVDFDGSDCKQLLLKFAKLRIIKTV